MTDDQRIILEHITTRDGGIVQKHGHAARELGFSGRKGGLAAYSRAVGDLVRQGWLDGHGKVTPEGRDALKTK